MKFSVKRKEYLILIVSFAIGTFLHYGLFNVKAYDIGNNHFVSDKLCGELEKENRNNELVLKQNFKNIYYILYKEGDSFKSYFVNKNDNSIKDISVIIKKDKLDEYESKINELLNLKYPKFIVDEIEKKSDKNYYIKDNEMIIYYNNLEINTNEQLFLTVNYNEIKDYLDITFKLDSTYENEDGYNYDPNKKSVALTFDDGPNGSKTLELLDILKENKAHATFFMVGNKMEYYKTVVTTVHNSGNEIGSHTYNHCNLKTAKIAKVLENEQLTANIYYGLTSDVMTYTRPPYGSINEKVRNSLDTIFVNWSIDPEDWRYKDVEHIKNEIMSHVSDGDIILLHDSYETSVEAVRQVLPLLYQDGYQVVSVSDLAKLKGRTLEKNTIYRRIS